MNRVGKAGLGLAAATTAGVGYAAGYEVRAFTLRYAAVPCLPPGRPPLTVLHLSDVHMTPHQTKKQRWLETLAALEPDLVVNTGDNLSHRESVPEVLRALGGLLELPGVFVLGSNDYWGPIMKSPLRYLLPDGGGKQLQGPKLPWWELRDGFKEAGWLDLTNRRDEFTVRGCRISFAGVDDPHLGYDELSSVAGEADATAALRVGVTHAPYLRVLDAFTRDGYEVIFAGHTHGGQVRLPGFGALVTNCDIDTGRSRGLHSHAADGRRSWLHVSAGLGTSPYAPYRFCCRPEATLVTLYPGSVQQPPGRDVVPGRVSR
jgi:uncharacterized protein